MVWVAIVVAAITGPAVMGLIYYVALDPRLYWRYGTGLLCIDSPDQTQRWSFEVVT